MSTPTYQTLIEPLALRGISQAKIASFLSTINQSEYLKNQFSSWIALSGDGSSNILPEPRIGISDEGSYYQKSNNTLFLDSVIFDQPDFSQSSNAQIELACNAAHELDHGNGSFYDVSQAKTIDDLVEGKIRQEVSAYTAESRVNDELNEALGSNYRTAPSAMIDKFVADYEPGTPEYDNAVTLGAREYAEVTPIYRQGGIGYADQAVLQFANRQSNINLTTEDFAGLNAGSVKIDRASPGAYTLSEFPFEMVKVSVNLNPAGDTGILPRSSGWMIVNADPALSAQLSRVNSTLQALSTFTDLADKAGKALLVAGVMYTAYTACAQIFDGNYEGASKTLLEFAAGLRGATVGAEVGGSIFAAVGFAAGALLTGGPGAVVGMEVGEFIGTWVGGIVGGNAGVITWDQLNPEFEKLMDALGEAFIINDLKVSSQNIQYHPDASAILSIPYVLTTSMYNGTKALFRYAHIDPVVIDLSGTGVSLRPLDNSSPYFDFQGNSHPEQTAWVGAGTGFLAIVGPDGLVSNATNLISSLDQLRAMDADVNGVLDGSDPGYGTLAVWQDFNGDGISEPGELSSLASLGIVSLALGTVTSTITTVDGQVVTATSLARMQDGSTREIAQVELSTDPMSTKSTSFGPVSPKIILLPQLEGYGLVSNLQVAMTNDEALVDLVSATLASHADQTAQFDQEVESVMLEWSGSPTVSSAISSTFDLQKLAFMVAFFGDSEGFGKGSPYPSLNDQASYLEESWNQLFSGTKARLMIQTHNSVFYDAFIYDTTHDAILPQNTLAASIARVSSDNSTSSSLGGWINALTVINESVRDMDAYVPQNASQILSALQQNIIGLISTSVLQGVSTGTLNIVENYGPNATLFGSAPINLFVANQVDQTIVGHGQGDEIIVQRGTSNLHIQESGPSEVGAVIVMDGTFTEASVTFEGNSHSDLVLFSDGKEVLKIDSALTAPQNSGIQALKFIDGTALTLHEIVDLEMNPTTNASGSIYGSSHADILDGQGVDTLLGGNGGGDTFVYNRGYGSLKISEQDDTNLSSDILSLGAGISPSDITVTSDVSGNLILNVNGASSGTIKLSGMLTSSTEGVGAVLFSDGTTWTRQQLLTMADTGAAANSTITSMLRDQVIDPAGAAHTVNLAGGNSVIEFGLGYGAVEINQVDPNPADQNTLVFKSAITPADVIIATDGLGNILLTVGNNGDLVKLDGMVFGPSNGVQSIHFADGTTWSAQDVISQVSQTLTGYYNTVTFNKGMGEVTMSAQSVSAIEFGPDVADGDAVVQSDAAGNMIITFMDDAYDRLILTGDIHQIATEGGQAQSLVHQLSYSSGASISLQGGLVFQWHGSEDVRLLGGSNMGTNIFYLGLHGDHVIAGNSSWGGSGFNEIRFGKGDGPATVDMNGGSGVVYLSAGITRDDIALQSDVTGKLTIKVLDTGDTLTINDGLKQTPFGPSSPIDFIQLSDGSAVPLAINVFTPQPLVYSWVGVGDGKTMVGSPWGANTFIVGPGDAQIIAGDGSKSSVTDNFNYNTFYYDQGDGNAVVDMSGAIGEVDLAPDILPQSVIFQADQAGDLTIKFLGDSSDSLELKGDLVQRPWGVGSRASTLVFGDGTPMKLGLTSPLDTNPILFTWIGTPTNTNLVGSGFGANVFDLGPGGDTVTAGNGSQNGSIDNTFLFGWGDGNAVVTMNGGAGTLQLDASIMRSNVRFSTNAQGDITVSIKGDTTDSITFLSDIYYTPFGPGSRLGAIQYGDGTTQQLGIHSYQSFMPTFTETGTAANTVLVGSNYGDNAFEFGPAASDGSGDTVIAGNPSQGGSGYNTFKLALGSGHVHVTLGGGYGVLQLGAGLSASSLLLEANTQGDVTFAFANDSADSVTFTGDLYNRPFGPVSAINQVLSADGSSTPIGVIGYTDHPMTFTAIGTADNTVLTGSGFGANVFDFGLSDPYGFGDTVTAGNGSQGGSGLNTFNYGLGDGNAVVNMNGGWGVLNLGGNIILADLVFQADAQGNMTISIAGNTQDTIKFNADLSTGPYGTVSAVNKVVFSDGSSQMLDSAYWQGHPSGYA